MTNHDEEVKAFTDDTLFEVPNSKENPVDRWLIFFYVGIPLLMIFVLVYYFNGSHGWLDRGYWGQLQTAANTTFPSTNHNLKDEGGRMKDKIGNGMQRRPLQ